MEDDTAYPEEESLFEMAPLLQQHTGLAFIIWIYPKTSNPEPGIWVQGNYSVKLRRDLLFWVSISDAPEIKGYTGVLSEKDIRLLRTFVMANKEVLTAYWNESNNDLLRILSSLKKAGA